MSFRAGDTIEGYRVEAVLGEGGMGQVFRVRNLISGRREAMKIVLPPREGAQNMSERFLREIRVLASLDHPNIVRLHTALRVGDQIAMVMELVDGASLAEKLRTSGVATADAIRYISQVLDALAYAHRHGVVHRDVKPANILVTNAGAARLTDFGVAFDREDRALTASGAAVGSLHYMSPEQVRAEPVDGRSDIYSVGATLYEVVTGRHAVSGDSNWAVMNSHLHQTPIPPLEVNASLPPAVSDAILRALSKDPAGRFQTAAEFQAVLGGALSCAGATVTVHSELAGTSRFNAALLQGAKQSLALFLGPIAGVMVDRAARTAHTPQELYRVLAEQIPDTRERETFLKSSPLKSTPRS